MNCDVCGLPCESDPISISKKDKVFNFCSGDCEVMFADKHNNRR